MDGAKGHSALFVATQGNVKAKKLKKGGTLYARLQKAAPRSAGKLQLKLEGVKLKNVEGMFKKSDPFFEICRTHDGPGQGAWTPVYRSREAKNNLNPKWGAATIDVNALCDGDLDRKLRVRIFDHESNGRHQSMGTFDASVHDLLRVARARPAGSESFVPRKNGKPYGKIVATHGTIEGADAPPAAGAGHAVISAAAADPSISVMPVLPMPVPAPQFGGSVMPSRAPTFVDYVSGQCNMNLVSGDGMLLSGLSRRAFGRVDCSWRRAIASK